MKPNQPPFNDPAVPNPGSGRPPHEQRFIDFPDNPDLYGYMDPNPPINPMGRNDRVPCGNQSGGLPANFAPPGEFPTGPGRSPMQGVDGRGGLIVDPLRVQPKPQFKGDYDQMVHKGIIPPGPGGSDMYEDFNQGFGGNMGSELGPQPGFRGMPGMGGPRPPPRGGFGDGMGMGPKFGKGGGFGGPGFGGGFV